MNLEEMGKAVAEALALRGKMQSLENGINALTGQIETNEREMSRLQNLKVVTDKAKEKKAALNKEIQECQSELDKRLGKLEKEGVVLPLGADAGVKQINL